MAASKQKGTGSRTKAKKTAGSRSTKTAGSSRASSRRSSRQSGSSGSSKSRTSSRRSSSVSRTKPPSKGGRKSSSPKKAPSGSSKAKTRQEKSTWSSSSSSFVLGRLISGGLILLSWLLGLAAMFKLGIAGLFLNEAGQLLFGTLLYGLIVLGALWGFAWIWSGGHYRPGVRTTGGLLLLGLSWMLMAALIHTPHQDAAWAAWTELWQTLPGFESGTFSSPSGIFGALLAGVLVSLFSWAGAWIFAGVFLVMGMVLLSWTSLAHSLSASSEENGRRSGNVLRHLSSSRQAKEEQDWDEWSYGEEDGFDEEPEEEEDRKNVWSSSRSAWNERSSQGYGEVLERPGKERGRPGARELDTLQAGPSILEQIGPKHKTGRTFEREESALAGSDPFLNQLEASSLSDPDETPGQGAAWKPYGLEDSSELEEMESGSSRFSLSRIPLAETGGEPDPFSAGTGGTLVHRPPDDLADESSLRRPKLSRSKRKAAQAAPKVSRNTMEEALSSSPSAKSGASSALQADETGKAEERAPLYDPKTYRLPPVSLLNDPDSRTRSSLNLKNARAQGARLIEILKEFHVDARLGEMHIGPSVTEFEVIPGQGVRVNTFVNLQSDIKMALAARDIRIEAPIPGKSAVGIEVPNAEKTAVSMKELIQKVPSDLAARPLTFTLGKDLMGQCIYGRLDRMPHLLIAGATGSGKSVCVNSIICSILLRTRPDEVKLLLVDPKKVEFTPYNGIPHLLAPVITDANLASGALKVIVEMMDERYSLFEAVSVRNISSYNEHVKTHPQDGQPMPRIVVIIDELADLMLAASKDVEQSIQRITQLARAAGIHLIVATQRPSVNVITGVIKANIPSRIAFMVSSRVDSRTILDQSGAEKLLGYGDMLFLDNGESTPIRLQGVFIRDQEVEEICSFVKKQAQPAYADPFILLQQLSDSGAGEKVGGVGEELDPLYPEVKEFVIVSRKASTSLIQRRFHLGYGRAARILDQLEAGGIIGPSQGSRPREILVQSPAEEMEDYR